MFSFFNNDADLDLQKYKEFRSVNNLIVEDNCIIGSTSPLLTSELSSFTYFKLSSVPNMQFNDQTKDVN